MQHHDDISDRIASARRDAELLKERIKQRREALADTTCKLIVSIATKIIFSNNNNK
jgi:hypothetical protein